MGGDHLAAAINVMNLDGHVAMCGAISAYNATEPPAGPSNLYTSIGKRITLRGFVVSKYADMAPEFRTKTVDWLSSGDIRYDETVREGLENAPQAFIDLLDGANTGKMVVRL